MGWGPKMLKPSAWRRLNSGQRNTRSAVVLSNVSCGVAVMSESALHQRDLGVGVQRPAQKLEGVSSVAIIRVRVREVAAPRGLHASIPRRVDRLALRGPQIADVFVALLELRMIAPSF